MVHCSGEADDYDMIEETRTALLLNNSKGLETKLTPKNVFEIATKQNFEKLTLQMYLQYGEWIICRFYNY